MSGPPMSYPSGGDLLRGSISRVLFYWISLAPIAALAWWLDAIQIADQRRAWIALGVVAVASWLLAYARVSEDKNRRVSRFNEAREVQERYIWHAHD